MGQVGFCDEAITAVLAVPANSTREACVQYLVSQGVYPGDRAQGKGEGSDDQVLAADVEATRIRLLVEMFVTMGYRRGRVEKAATDTHGRGFNAILDWYKRTYRPKHEHVFHYSDACLSREFRAISAALRLPTPACCAYS